ncbi:glycosyltransferase [Tsukamurella sp. 1534]|uniref:glycosyltransferase n=1 Tax=Tsukamurella sp. 1534 TaxID=1151061 RepID=UPI0002F67A18|nr:glycosyltransferase [Tsukamurella sp. 1534]
MTGRRPAVFLGHTAAPSGAELAFARLAGELRRRGRTTSAVLLEPGPLVDVLQAQDVPVTVLPSVARRVGRGSGPLALVRGAVGMIRDGLRVAAVLRAHDAGVVVAQSTKTLLIGAVAARRAGVPLVWQVHDRISGEYFGPLRFPLRLLGRLAADGFLANSRGTLGTLRTRGTPAAVCPPGVDLAAVPPAAPQRPPAEARIAMVGRLTEWKGQDLVLEALAAMRTTPTVRFVGGVFFGEEQFAARVRTQAAYLGVVDRVTFTGHVEDPAAEIADADIVVHYSRLTEPFGQVVAEAMAAGRAVVAAKAGGPAEMIVDGHDGVLVRPGRPAELAAALDALIADPVRRARLGAAARERARDLDLRTSALIADALLSRVERDALTARAERAAP